MYGGDGRGAAVVVVGRRGRLREELSWTRGRTGAPGHGRENLRIVGSLSAPEGGPSGSHRRVRRQSPAPAGAPSVADHGHSLAPPRRSARVHRARSRGLSRPRSALDTSCPILLSPAPPALCAPAHGRVGRHVEQNHFVRGPIQRSDTTAAPTVTGATASGCFPIHGQRTPTATPAPANPELLRRA